MLVYTRSPREDVVIVCPSGEVVRVHVLGLVRGIEGGRPAIRLGFDAPRNVEIHRAEFLDPPAPRPVAIELLDNRGSLKLS